MHARSINRLHTAALILHVRLRISSRMTTNESARAAGPSSAILISSPRSRLESRLPVPLWSRVLTWVLIKLMQRAWVLRLRESGVWRVGRLLTWLVRLSKAPSMAQLADALTLSSGKRYIGQLAGALNIPQSISDAGNQIFKLAVANNFIQGRRTKSVAAVCLYIACRRQESNQHMLIDFSDILMVRSESHFYLKCQC